MELKIVIKKSSCKAENFITPNPAFFSEKECYGCSFYHVCKRGVANCPNPELLEES